MITICCIVLAWGVERRITNQTIFNPKHKEQAQNFHLFTSALQAEIGNECSSGAIHRIYFDDLDVGLPYTLNADSRHPNCQVVRALPITPFSREEVTRCSATIVQESHLGWWAPGVLRTKLLPSASPVLLIKQWSSPDGNFGFEVYRKAGCPTLAESTPQ